MWRIKQLKTGLYRNAEHRWTTKGKVFVSLRGVRLPVGAIVVRAADDTPDPDWVHQDRLLLRRGDAPYWRATFEGARYPLLFVGRTVDDAHRAVRRRRWCKNAPLVRLECIPIKEV